MTLRGELDAHVEDGSADPTVTVVFTVTNTGSEPIEAQFPTPCKADFAVERDGEELWRFTEGRMFAQVLSSERFEPGEPVCYDIEWPDPEPGSYTAIGELQARDTICEAHTEFSV